MSGIRYHPNAKTTIQIRKKIKESRESINQLAHRFGLNKSTVIKWRKREDLGDRSSRPHRLRTVLNAVEEWVICEVRRTTGLSSRDIAEVLKPFIPRLNHSIVLRCLHRYGVIEEERRKEAEARKRTKVGRFEEVQPGYVHIDVKELPKLPGEAKRKVLFVAIERATRWVYVSLKSAPDAKSAQEFLNDVVQQFSYRIHTVLTDNGKEFTDRYCRGKKESGGGHLFDKACQRYGIEHRLTRPYTPRTNGLVERFNGRIVEILKRHHFMDYTQLMQVLEKYIHCYNYVNKQRVLNNKSPAEKMIDLYHQDPSLFNPFFNPYDFNLSNHNTQAGLTHSKTWPHY